MREKTGRKLENNQNSEMKVRRLILEEFRETKDDQKKTKERA